MIELNKLHAGLTYEQYDAEPGLRAGYLKTLRFWSPAHLKVQLAQPQESTEALEFGKVFHAMVENGEKFLDTYRVEPEFKGLTKDGRESSRSNEAKEKRAQWYADLPTDAIVVKAAWVDNLIGMCRSLKSHKLVGNMVKDGMREGSLWVQDPETGVILKCRPDFITAMGGFLVDFKSTRCAQWWHMKHEVFSDRSGNSPYYILQMAHYVHCLKVAGLGSGEAATIIAIEKEAPWGVRAWPLDVGHLGVGEQWRQVLTRQYAECLEKSEWPSYEEKAISPELPQYIQTPDDVYA